MSTFKTIMSEYQLGNLQLKNRIALAPMTRVSAEKDGCATERMARYYSSFAEGGFKLLITEGAYPDEAYSQGYFNQPGIANEAHVKAWKTVTDAVHAKGSKIICQLMHAGALSQGNINKDETVAPSAVKPKGEKLKMYAGEGEFSIPREITKEEIRSVIEGFVNAASNAKKAGFDGVEIHGANGYLLDQFLTEYTNQRNDEYGGTTENRVRIICEIIKAVKEKVGDNFVVGIRISLAKINDYTHKWSLGEDDARIIFEKIGAEKPHYIHTTDYRALHPAFGESGPTLAELAKKYGNTTVIVNGNLDQPSDAEEALTKGSDIIALGKAALANHDWVKKAKSGQSIEEFTGDVLSPDAILKDKEL
ncbi:NADH:flavin oxidoreductase [Aneurinibacillus sp. Ricciae_BoGa-3]|uniref:NADH:flavin oxidoreductase n=1 Tax=Aneurinibacillus sp. Ricciae_BoGa-3 TaxID=3022697 RepID=UPI002340E987|nr:NADH:flavin oxidoreductase [Aneurinibacillus sp. Ricciae_BoGa-3]WCK52995.1 NADH:flavin oxidoreductase [Aneurinibacillus sp. Ricciae_BoGa-3]